MSEQFGAGHLSATRHYVLVLRLVLAPTHREAYGDVLDPETKRRRPFIGREQLCNVVGEWLDEAERLTADGRADTERPPD